MPPGETSEDDVHAMVDRAGDVLREQMATIVDSARRSAAEMERSSEQRGSATTQAAKAETARVVERLRAIEQELGALVRGVSRESDRLRSVVARTQVHTRPAQEALERPAPEAPQIASGDAAADVMNAPQATAEAPAPVATADAGLEEAEEAPSESGPAGLLPADPPPPRPDRDDDALSQARARVRTVSDRELASLYGAAEDEHRGDPPWEALKTAVLDEARRRINFGVAFEPDQSLTRRDRRREQRAIDRLRAVCGTGA